MFKKEIKLDQTHPIYKHHIQIIVEGAMAKLWG
jgi:hypothetical protein